MEIVEIEGGQKKNLRINEVQFENISLEDARCTEKFQADPSINRERERERGRSLSTVVVRVTFGEVIH